MDHNLDICMKKIEILLKEYDCCLYSDIYHCVILKDQNTGKTTDFDTNEE